MCTFANSKDLDEMQHNEAYPVFVKLKKISRKHKHTRIFGKF